MPWLIGFLGFLDHRFPWPLAFSDLADARQRIIEELDERALDALERSALSKVRLLRSTATLVRRLEDAFPGDWTGEL